MHRFVAGEQPERVAEMVAKWEAWAKRAQVLPWIWQPAFADPAGSFTTAAAMVACVEKTLKQKKGKTLANTRIVIFGATGPVGYTSGVIFTVDGGISAGWG